MISQSNTCQEVPKKKCGNNAHGSKFFKVEGEMSEAGTCQYGGSLTTFFKKKVEYKCNDGSTSKTGKTENGSKLREVNQCKPKPKKDCGDNAHGSKFFKVEGEVSEAGTCEFGGTMTKFFENKVQYKCTDGATAKTGKTEKGSKLRVDNQCKPKPKKDCGDKKHGEKWFVVNGEMSEAKQCVAPKVGEQTLIFEKKVQKSCTDGVVAETGKTQKGTKLRTEGKCKNPNGGGGGNTGGTASCSAATLKWGIEANEFKGKECKASVDASDHGAKITLSSSTSYTGSAIAKCVDGKWRVNKKRNISCAQ